MRQSRTGICRATASVFIPLEEMKFVLVAEAQAVTRGYGQFMIEATKLTKD
jgi:hypothetical protein